MTIKKIFEDKGWDFMSNVVFNKAFDNATEIYSKLGGAKRDLFVEMLELYDFISLEEYSLLMKNMTHLLLDLVKDTKRLYFIPLISLTNNFSNHIVYSTPDSSSLITYFQRSLNFEIKRSIKGNIYFNSDTYETVGKTFKNTINKNGYIVISDDFSGTGLSIVKTIKNLETQSKQFEMDFKQENIIIFVLVITIKAKEYIESQFPGVKLITGRITQTIHDIYKDDQETIQLIKNLSSKFYRKKADVLGFANSGCLVSLLRTPNNTLGIFRGGRYPVFERKG